MNKETSMEDLLKPRVKVISPWPNMDEDYAIAVGDVLKLGKPVKRRARSGGRFIPTKEFTGEYPHLFKELAWYEEREDDFFKNIKYWKVVGKEYEVVKKGSVITANDFKWWGFDKDELSNFFPATEAEYQSYLSQIKQTNE
jgi:hypothetical protein